MTINTIRTQSQLVPTNPPASSVGIVNGDASKLQNEGKWLNKQAVVLLAKLQTKLFMTDSQTV